MEVEHIHEEQVSKKGRHRKKYLYNSILKQMEFYLSDSNLSKDRLLSQLIQTDPFVELSFFMKCNKIRKLTSNVEDIKKAINNSELIELSEDKLKVRRKVPVKVKENVDDCTIYVERLKSDVTHEWLTSIFSEFGNVVYVSIPKYKQNGMIKGFAFIEFEDVEGANSALKYYESIGCKIPSFMEPEKLCSIVTFEGESKVNGEVTENAPGVKQEQEECSKKRTHSESFENEISEDEGLKKKVKHEGKEVKEVPDEKEIHEVANEKDANEVDQKEVNEVLVQKEVKENSAVNCDNEAQIEENQTNKKIKKSNKKKSNLKEIGLQILSKKEWKRMRNRYLNMQRTTMKQLKMHLNRQKFNNKYLKEEKNKPVEVVEKSGDDKVTSDFMPGIIVKVTLKEPCEDNKKLKAEIKTLSSEIKFIDIPNPVGSEDIFIRFSNDQHAQRFCSSNFDKGKCIVLNGDDEETYWSKIKNARLLKDKKIHNKQRGRDKLLKKAEKQGLQHIRFDDNESDV